MRSVTVQVPAADLARAMVVMREWLDVNRCEPRRFDCRKRGAQVVLFVDFSTGVAAEGFARRFGGETGAPASAQG
jgi:hypothetical protein